MDARHFAEEFIRRKKLADKGVVEKSTPSAGGASSGSGADGPKGAGWSEVAKKGSKDNDAASAPAGFKVVPSRKKGKK